MKCEYLPSYFIFFFGRYSEINRHPNPRVRAAWDSSSPILTEQIIMGTIRYSKIVPALPPPKRTPRIRMASPMALHSSATVGKKRNITDIGMVICCGRWSRSIAATNSLTVVVAVSYTHLDVYKRQ